MHISFFPTLSSTTRVPLGISEGNDESESQQGFPVSFTARLSHADYQEAVNSGARIELWTNVPTNKNPTNEWHAIAFEDVDSQERLQPGALEDASVELAISEAETSDAYGGGDRSSEHTFRAAFDLPRLLGHSYSFTYRIVYPSGISWLGTDHTDGVLKLVDGDGFFDETGSWMTSETGKAYESAEENKEDIIVGRLNTAHWTWSGWALDESRAWYTSNLSDGTLSHARMVYLFPAAVKEIVMVAQPLVLHASFSSSPISISADGQVVLHTSGQGAVERTCHALQSPKATELLHSIIASSCPGPEIWTRDQSWILLTPNNVSNVSATVYVLPLSSRPSHTIAVPVSVFDALTTHTSTVSLYSSYTQGLTFLNKSDDERRNHARLEPGNTGGFLTVSAVYELNDGKENALQISVPTCLVPPEREHQKSPANPLPTPPASPRPKPRQTVSFVLPPDDEKENASTFKDFDEPPRTTANGHETRMSVPPNTSRYSIEGTALELTSRFRQLHLSARLQALIGDGRIRGAMFTVLSMLAWAIGLLLRQMFILMFHVLPRPRTPMVRAQEVERQESHDSGAKLPPSLSRRSTAEKMPGEYSPLTRVPKSSSLPPNEHGHDRASTSGPTADEPTLRSGIQSVLEASLQVHADPSNALRWRLPQTAGDSNVTILVRSKTGTLKSGILEVIVDGAVSDPIVRPVGEDMEILEVPRSCDGAPSSLLVKLKN